MFLAGGRRGFRAGMRPAKAGRDSWNGERSSGALIVNALVALKGPAAAQTHTDDKGRFAFRCLPYGSYRLQAQASGFADEEHEERIAARSAQMTRQSVCASPASSPRSRLPTPAQSAWNPIMDRERPNSRRRISKRSRMIPTISSANCKCWRPAPEERPGRRLSRSMDSRTQAAFLLSRRLLPFASIPIFSPRSMQFRPIAGGA